MNGKGGLLILHFFILNFAFGQMAPSATDDYDTAELDTVLDIVAPGVLENDSDADNDTLTIIGFSINGINYIVGETAVFPEGSISINADGGYVFTPATGYTGNVPIISYTISDGTFTTTANLYLTVEQINDLLEISVLGSCNQGYTVDGTYKIRYNLRLRNTSTARDYHANNLIENINLTYNFDAIFGTGCATDIENMFVSTPPVADFVGNPYPLEFDNGAVNPDFIDTSSYAIFSSEAIDNLILYPRQSIYIEFCVTVNPFCDGRPNPTPSGSGIDFDSVFNVTSNRGNNALNLLLTDFHTTEALVTAGLFVEEPSPEVNPDATYDFTNTVILTNEGTSTATNVNYNMGLGNFLDIGISFAQIIINQVSGPNVTINANFDGDTDTELLAVNNSLAPNETIILEIYYLTDVVATTSSINFAQFSNSQTQGNLDGFDEDTALNKRIFSYVYWSDNLGNHLDRYYITDSPTQAVSSAIQCQCQSASMNFAFTASTSCSKSITNINEAPNGILEHEAVTFQFTITNTSNVIQLENLQIRDNLSIICSGNIISSSLPSIVNTNASTVPNLNTNYDGITDINFFDGSSGLLLANEFVTLELTVVFNENCIGTNTASFLSTDPLNNTVSSSGSVLVNAITDTDNDGITNVDDIDDDNDTIPDVLECLGLDPLADDDLDFIPNYRDSDFGLDSNNDGVVDRFDFDLDGVPNHLDLDSDNDGVFDIVEARSIVSNLPNTINPVGANGLDNTVEDNDTQSASINYQLVNTDNQGLENYLDIDADNDGIVDNIEGQSTLEYLPPNGIVNNFGLDTAYLNGISPVDTDSDTFFDFVDINSDNDIRNDIIEGWDFNNDGTPETTFSGADNDNDGLDDAYDNNSNLINPSNGQVPLDFPNVDNVDNLERDWREIIAVVVLIHNAFATEGSDLVFTVSLVTKNDNSILIESATPIDISMNTENGAVTTNVYDIATAPFDYDPITNIVLTIPPYTESAEFTVSSTDDIIFEIDEFFTLNGTIISNNTINTEAQGIGTILDNDLPPDISMNNTLENEGVDLIHTISISHPCSTPININVNTFDDTAIAPDDYASISNNFIIEGTINPSDANTQISFNITTEIDNLNEPDEEILNVIGSVTTTNVGLIDLTKTGTIVDIDPDPLVVIDDVTVVEGNPLMFTISLLNANNDLMRNYLPIEMDVVTISETASASLDFETVTTIATIPAFTSQINQSVETFDDTLNEETETMQLEATILSVGVSNINLSIQATGTIKDNDFPNLFSPNSDGYSDTFYIAGIEDFPNFKLVIVDRWGSEVFNYSNNGRTSPIWWDGTHKGKPVLEGVYFYTLDFNDGETPAKTSFIQLIR